MANITIGMVTYNRLYLTKQTIVSALKDTGEKFNLVVIDNCSSDETVEFLYDEKYLREQMPNMVGYHVRCMKKNYGIAYGRNICLVETDKAFPETEYYATLDNDVSIPNKNWLKQCKDVLDCGDNIGACAINFEHGKVLPYTNLKLKDQTELKVRIILNTPGTAATMFKKADRMKLGFFKRYGELYSQEDADWFFRMQKLGKILIYLDEPGIHLGEGNNDTGEYREMKTREFNKYKPEFIKMLRYYHNGGQLYLDFKEENDC